MNCNKEKVNRAIKYIIIALLTGAFVKYIAYPIPSDKQIIIISCLVSISYAILDRLAPSIN